MFGKSDCFTGLKFSFDGKPSDLYGLYMAWRGADEEWETGLTRELIKGEPNMARHIPNLYGARYPDPLLLEFDIFHQDGSAFAYQESRHINNWLVQDGYRKFKVNDSNTDNVYYRVICTGIQDITIGTFCGKHITMTCDSSFGYAQDAIKTVDATQSFDEIRKMNCTDDTGVNYPTVILFCPAGYEDSVELINHTDNNSMVLDMADIEAVDGKKKLCIDSANMMMTDGNGKLVPLYKIGWAVAPDENDAVQSSELYWFRLVRGLNEIEVKGNVKAVIKASFLRKAGQINEQ